MRALRAYKVWQYLAVAVLTLALTSCRGRGDQGFDAALMGFAKWIGCQPYSVMFLPFPSKPRLVIFRCANGAPKVATFDMDDGAEWYVHKTDISVDPDGVPVSKVIGQGRGTSL